MQKCPLCQREMIDGPSIDRHHLVPKSHGGKEQFFLHRICHQKIHSLFTEHELSNYYHTWERLIDHSDIQKFVLWVKKKPAEYFDRNKRAKRKT